MDESFRKVLPLLRPRTEYPWVYEWLADAVVATALVVVVALVAWTLVQRSRWRRHIRESFALAAAERGLDPAQIALLLRITGEGRMHNPLLVLSSLDTYDHQVGEFVGRRRAASELSSVVESLEHIRSILGFDDTPPGRSMRSTRQLKAGQRLMVWPVKGSPRGFCQCVVAHRDDDGIVAVPLLRVDDHLLAQLQAGDRIKARFWREHDTEYRFRTHIRESDPETTSILIEHTDKLEHTQKRDFYRLKVHFDLALHPASGEGQNLSGVVTDISGGGLSLATPGPVSAGDLYRVDPDFEGPFPIAGQACQIVDDEAMGEGRRLGLEFTHISRKRQGDLVNAIFHLEVQRSGS